MLGSNKTRILKLEQARGAGSDRGAASRFASAGDQTNDRAGPSSRLAPQESLGILHRLQDPLPVQVVARRGGPIGPVHYLAFSPVDT